MEDLLKRLGLDSAAQKITAVDPAALRNVDLTPEEGFLMSRIDAAQSLQEVLQTSPFPREKTISLLSRLAQAGLIMSQVPMKGPTLKNGEAAEDFREVTEVYQQLRDKKVAPHVLLGVSSLAPEKELKKAYFVFSKKFHPDRLTRRGASKEIIQMGEYIVAAADRLLKEVPEKSKKESRFKQSLMEMAQDGERIQRAQTLFQEAKKTMRSDPLAALNALRIVVTYDANNEEAKKLMSDVERQLQGKKAGEFFKKAKELEEALVYDRAGHSYEAAAQADPKNPLFLRACADFFLHKGDEPEKALIFICEVVALEPRNIEHHLVHGMTLKALKRFNDAQKVFEGVLKLDKGNVSAKNQIAELGKKKLR